MMLGLCWMTVTFGCFGWIYSLFQCLFLDASSSLQPSTCSFHAHRRLLLPLELPNDLPFWEPRILLNKISHFKPLVFWSIHKVCALTQSGDQVSSLCSAPHQGWLLLALTLRNELWSLKKPCVLYCLFPWPWSSFLGKCLMWGLDHLLRIPQEAGNWSWW